MEFFNISTYRKRDERQLSIFDLPGEVRNRVYQEFFDLDNRLSVHLINSPSDPEVKQSTEDAVLSSVYRESVAADNAAITALHDS